MFVGKYNEPVINTAVIEQLYSHKKTVKGPSRSKTHSVGSIRILSADLEVGRSYTIGSYSNFFSQAHNQNIHIKQKNTKPK